ncbi:hypothetical protein SEA_MIDNIGHTRAIN_75 [Arthrobacter phage MidnightRain]|nr:hypothetical protein SEA_MIDNIGHTRAIN_75 [Arthrobacter phage MidnightRain]
MSEHKRHGACPTSQKRCFPTRADAKRNLRLHHLKDVTVYKCQDCGYFHQGGWHGTKDRAAHRSDAGIGTMTIEQACRELAVSPTFIERLIESGKVRAENGAPYRADIERIGSL